MTEAVFLLNGRSEKKMKISRKLVNGMCIATNKQGEYLARRNVCATDDAISTLSTRNTSIVPYNHRQLQLCRDMITALREDIRKQYISKKKAILLLSLTLETS